ncbi:MAG: tRNA (N(6)-L-threonylcarbamoyladenosine(37)-C(2))-methylthiotransferase MtaB [Alphaproteobacteria bacterium]
MTGVEVITFGCRLNAYESEVIRALGAAAGLDDTVIVNTCAVTAEAERQARQAIRRVRRERPDARIVVTGCAVQADPDRFAAMPEVNRVIGNAEKLTAEGLGAGARVLVNDIMAATETAAHLVPEFAERARAFVQVQNGCDHRCTFCIIPLGRGPSRSVPPESVVAAVRRQVEAGIIEIVLTGVDVTAYGADLPGRPTLGRLARRVLDGVPGLARLRLTSLDVAEVDDELMGVLAEEPRLMPHLHLGLQAGADLILKRMKRRHGRAQAIAFAERARRQRPGLALGADLIAGFPTETEEQFAETLALIEDCGLTHLHVFPYSPRPGTAAARMPQVPVALRKERAARLRAAGEAALARYAAGFVGRRLEVLVEHGTTARTEHYLSVELDRPRPEGALVAIETTGLEGTRLRARTLA